MSDSQATDPRYQILFEPVTIGPKVARNRFFQVPHCNGMGFRHPSALAGMREAKAEGGWAVVCTEEVEIHHTSELEAAIEGRLWDDADIPYHARTVEAIQRHGALAGIELTHSGLNAPNSYSRVAAMGPSVRPVTCGLPAQGRAMTLDDIADVRRWHRQAVRRSVQAGYDLVYVYAGHGLSLLQHFLSRRLNSRTDHYGGSLENRARLLTEIMTDTLEECEGQTAVACRIVVDELIGSKGLERSELEELFGLIGELPDLWDLMVGEWDFDSSTSRFESEGYDEPFVTGFKQLTSKPVVVVGRYTSPDSMVRVVNQGIADFIGAARPSIADPFLPRKIEQGRLDDIRECIGCNICVASDWQSVPVRCTQNSAMGEEWRRGWHPETIRPKVGAASNSGGGGGGGGRKIMVVGAGPAGLEAAMWLGRRGYEVVLTEATRELGGRVISEARLPGLAEWARVRDHRALQLDKLDNVLVAFESLMTAEELASYDFTDVAVATGSSWRTDGIGRWHTEAFLSSPAASVLSVDDILAGQRPAAGSRVIVFDDDHFYLGGVLAEALAAVDQCQVTLVTPDAKVSSWTVNTMEQEKIHRRLVTAGVEIATSTTLLGHDGETALLACAYTGAESTLAADMIVPVTIRNPNASLVDKLCRLDGFQPGARTIASGATGTTVTAIGDCWNPGTIAEAVHHGRLYAESFDREPMVGADAPPFRREIIALAEQVAG